MFQDMNLPAASYCQNNREKTTKMIQDGLCLMGFDNDKICITGNLTICEFRLSQPPYNFSKSLQK